MTPWIPFKGKLRFNLVGDIQRDVSETDRMYARSVASSVGVDAAVLYNGETAIA